MVFASMTFLWVFLPVTLVLYYILAILGKQEIKNLLLLFMSILFYSFGEPEYILLLLLSALVNYLGGLYLDGRKGLGAKAGVSVAVLVNLGLLGYFKYYNFFAGTVNRLGAGEILPVRDIALPVGISFYTFQALSYVIDVYRGNCRVQKSFYKLLLYISFFPQLIAGPIVRYRDVAEQIDSRRETFDRFSQGVSRFIIGLSKKVILANTFAQAVDRVFAMSPSDRSPGTAWFAMALYAMQIYFDFGGYSDMAIGLGKMFGFEFLENFHLPYVSRSVREFWRRWHISLSTWFREYLYIPLGGSRRGDVRTYCNLLIVFLATGFWHGAGWNFIIWGMIHGFFMVIERVFAGKLLERNPIKLLNHGYCLLVVLTAWVFFRAETLGDAGVYLKTMFGLAEPARPKMSFHEIFGMKCLVLSVVGMLLAGLVPEGLQRRIAESGAFQALALPVCLLVCVMLLAAGSYNPFIYFRF